MADTSRQAGLLVPLFSIPSRSSWGIGEIPDLAVLAAWLRRAGFRFVQLLPINEMQEGQSSPYSALTAMAIDPIFIALRDVPEFLDAGGEAGLDSAARARLAAARSCEVVDYASVRALKSRALRAAFDRFTESHWLRRTARAHAFARFRAREAWWLRDYALFRALHDEHGARYWVEWEPGVRHREPAALDAARIRLERQILYYEYLQWLADGQWRQTRAECGGVGIFGDFPFMVSAHSADVWSRQDEFQVDVSVGVPPDAFSETGQDWGLPACRWDVMAGGGYRWLEERSRRCAELFDGFRVDHLVGFYRTFVRDRDGRTAFVPPDEPSQRAQGEALLRLFASHGATIVAEDLGTVPDFVRASMAALGIPGLKVFRWERDWDAPGRPFRDPAAYPEISVAVSGTHDTETAAEWWDNADSAERTQVVALPRLRESGCDPAGAWSDRLRDRLLDVLFAARSRYSIVALQDLFGWRDRINTPASVGDQNWTWRLPGPIDELTASPPFKERAAFVRALVERHDRA